MRSLWIAQRLSRKWFQKKTTHASERFWNGKRSHCPVGPFWNVLERQVLPFRSRTVRKGMVPFTLCLATVPEQWERSRCCSVNGVLQETLNSRKYFQREIKLPIQYIFIYTRVCSVSWCITPIYYTKAN